MTPADVIRKVIPNADSDEVHDIVWSRTAYPFVKLTARMLYKATSTYARAANNHLILCEFCDNIARPDESTCVKCDVALRKARESR